MHIERPPLSGLPSAAVGKDPVQLMQIRCTYSLQSEGTSVNKKSDARRTLAHPKAQR